MKLRLQKILAEAGISSRREAETFILAGRVTVNGRIVRSLGSKADPESDLVAVDGRPLGPPETKAYFVLYKPRGVITSRKDERGRKTVADLIRSLPFRLFPAGRLDYDAEGVLIMTNDGELAMALTHPSYQVSRTYLTKVRGFPSPSALAFLRRGSGSGPSPRVRLVKKTPKNCWIEITLTTGRYHEVKEICAAAGHPVLRLIRTAHGCVTLEGLQPGEYRPLLPREVRHLRTLLRTFHGNGEKIQR